MKKILLGIAVFAALGFMITSCQCSNKKAEEEAKIEAAKAEAKKQAEVDSLMALLPEEPVFDIVTNFGNIKIKLYKNTPKHRDNFARLALSHFYDGLLFHRVIKGFMIQGGDPNTRNLDATETFGKGGPGYTIPAEIIEGNLHIKGALAAARRGDRANPTRESSGSQFYIVQDPNTCAQLDGDYTVFGETIEGFDVIDKIALVRTNNRDLPINPVKILSIKADPSNFPIPEPTEVSEEEDNE